jgi:integral membrane sensor domain MASE1
MATKAKSNTKTNQKEQTTREQFKVAGGEVLEKVKKLIKEGNVRRIIIKNEKGKTLMEIPVTFAVVGAFFAPMLAAIGALAALLSNVTIEVERK